MNISSFSATLTEALLRSDLEQGGARRLANPPFTIAISREVGALGLATAAELGRQLGWPVYDQELIHKVAEEIGRKADHIGAIDEKDVGWFSEFLGNLSNAPQVSPITYKRKLAGVVRALGDVGKCIIVGRGANWILPRETTLRVRLIANLPDRVRVIARLKGLSERDATRYIEKTEKERIQFVKTNFEREPTDPHEYDLILNTSFIDVGEVARIIIETLHLFENCGENARRKEKPAMAAVASSTD